MGFESPFLELGREGITYYARRAFIDADFCSLELSPAVTFISVDSISVLCDRIVDPETSKFESHHAFTPYTPHWSDDLAKSPIIRPREGVDHGTGTPVIEPNMH